MARISIIIPVYNVEQYLPQCIDSVRQQTHQDIEIILVNDGSTDRSSEVCDRYADIDPRITVIHKPNGGLSDARNAGTARATGTYLTYLDSDDWLEPNTCKLAYNKALEGPYDLVFWQMIKEYESGSVFVKGLFGEDRAFEGDTFKQLHRTLAGPIGLELANPPLIDSFASAWGKLYKTEIIKNNNLFQVDTKIVGSEDILFNLEYFSFSRNAYYLHKHLIHYRKDNPTSLTKTHGSTLFSRFLNLFDHMEAVIQRLNLGDAFLQGLSNRVCISMMNVGLSEVSPRNIKSRKEKIKALNTYLNHDRYITAYKNLRFEYFPIHWRLFYRFCKWRFGVGVYWMLKGMQLFIRK